MLTNKNKLYQLIVFGVLILISGCDKDINDPETDEYIYQVPELTADGWETASLDNVTIDIAYLNQMMNYINSTQDHNIHSILIMKDNKLVFEEYFDGYLYSSDPPGSNGDYISYDREVDHYLASVSKTITSVIFGAAVKEGFIDDINDNVVNVFPEYENILTGDKANITVHHLLTMSSGLAWDESSTSYENPANDVAALFNSEDPIAYTLSRTLLYPPGTQFLYNSGGTNVLGAIIEKATGISFLDFGNEYLFDPLNIEGGAWQRFPSGYYFASGGIFFRPRELAKIGFLFLNNGYWENHQVVTEEWISESISEHIITQGRTLPLADGYGYQWWLQDYYVNEIVYESFMAAGWGDQYMIIFPEQNLLVLFNGGNYWSSGSISPFDLVEDYVLRAL